MAGEEWGYLTQMVARFLFPHLIGRLGDSAAKEGPGCPGTSSVCLRSTSGALQGRQQSKRQTTTI